MIVFFERIFFPMLVAANFLHSCPLLVQKQSFGAVLFMLLFLKCPYSVGKVNAYINSLKDLFSETLIWTLSIITETRRTLKHKDSEENTIVENDKPEKCLVSDLDIRNLKKSLCSP